MTFRAHHPTFRHAPFGCASKHQVTSSASLPTASLPRCRVGEPVDVTEGAVPPGEEDPPGTTRLVVDVRSSPPTPGSNRRSTSPLPRMEGYFTIRLAPGSGLLRTTDTVPPALTARSRSHNCGEWRIRRFVPVETLARRAAHRTHRVRRTRRRSGAVPRMSLVHHVPLLSPRMIHRRAPRQLRQRHQWRLV
jgi:hypothetical protein